MNIKTHINAGGMQCHHNQPAALRLKSGVNAGGMQCNHNQPAHHG